MFQTDGQQHDPLLRESVCWWPVALALTTEAALCLKTPHWL